MTSPFIQALSGSVAASVALTLCYPLDITKTRLQVNKQQFLDIVKEITDNGKHPLRIYTGLGSAVVGTFSTNFCYFWWYSLLRSDKERSVAMELLLGACAGGLAQLMTIPISVVTTRQQVLKERLSVLEVVDKIVKEDGIFGLWSGIRPALVLTVNPAITYGIFEQVKKSKAEWSSFEIFLLGVLCKTAATLVTYPYILAKTRQQAKGKQTSSVKLLTKIIKEDGVTGIYTGIQGQGAQVYFADVGSQENMKKFGSGFERYVTASAFHSKDSVIYQEIPILTSLDTETSLICDLPYDWLQMIYRYSNLDQDTRSLIQQLSNLGVYSKVAQQADPDRLPYYQEQAQLLADQLSLGYQDILDFLAILETNCHSRSFEQLGLQDQDYEVVALSLELSMLQHSCMPNATIEFVTKDNQLTLQLKALTDISENEQITISYHDMEFIGREERQLLCNMKGFECGCWLCRVDDPSDAYICPCFDSVQYSQLCRICQNPFAVVLEDEDLLYVAISSILRQVRDLRKDLIDQVKVPDLMPVHSTNFKVYRGIFTLLYQHSVDFNQEFAGYYFEACLWLLACNCHYIKVLNKPYHISADYRHNLEWTIKMAPDDFDISPYK